MKIYFVDLENISVTALCTTQEIDAGDLVFIFYSDVCKKSAAKIKDNISENGIIYKTIKAKSGITNALDFQLSSYLGYIISKNICNNYECIIVSYDKGYEVVCDFWKKRGINIHRIDNFSHDTNLIRKKVTISELRPYLDKKDIKYETDILNIVNTVVSKQKLHGNLGKIIRNSARTGKIYKRIKPLFLSQFKSFYNSY